MDWQGRSESDNLENGESSSGGGGGFGGGGFKLGGGVLVIVAIIALIMGKNPLTLISQIQGSGPTQTTQQVAPLDPNAPEDPEIKFIRVVLKDTEITWDSLFTVMGKTYEKPKLHLFRDQINSGCGNASTASGPFYCPADRKVYLDRAFFEELTNRFQAPGDLAKSYVISHEIGHHVQNLLGISDKMDEMRSRLSTEEYNKMSVKLELQADFLAGVFLHYEDKAQHIIHQGELESALKAAGAVGDDRLQKAAQGYVVPDAFTHGTSRERMYWLKKGFDTGDIKQGDTFSAASLDPESGM